MVLKSIKYRIYPNKDQREMFSNFFGCSRFIFNWGLDKKIKHYEKTQKSISCFALINELPNLKMEFEWLKDTDSQSLQMALRNLDNAFSRFFKLKTSFPKFKSKKSNRHSFQIPQRWKIEGKKLFLPKFKSGISIKISKEIKGKAKTITISKTPSGKYFAAIQIEENGEIPKKPKVNKEKTVGIDLGIKDFATFSDGSKIDNNHFLKRSLIKLKKLQRKHSRKKKGSNNRNKSRIKVARLHEKVVNQRKDFLHKLTTKTISENQTICIENLSVSNMVKNRKLSLAISEIGWYEFKRQLDYKCEWHGKNLIVIGRFDPSTKLCNSCGQLNDSLTLKDRIWECDCGTKHDRDINAAVNIKNFGIVKGIPLERRKSTPVRYENVVTHPGAGIQIL